MKKVILFYRKNTLFFSDSLQHSTRVLVYYLFNSCCQEIKFKKTWVFCFAFLLLIFNQTSFYGQSNTNNSQWGKNGPASAPASPVIWANGNAQKTNSHFTEGQSVPTRIELVDLTPNVPASVTFNINIIQGSDVKHAFDFFTGANRIDETVNPLDGLTGYGPRSLFTFPIPNAGNTGGVPAGYYDQTAIKMACQQATDAGSPEKNSIWIYNGTVTSITYVWGNEEGTSTQETYCTVTFIPTATKALLALGCHVAAENSVGCGGWGIGNGASAISGSPYHFHIQQVCSPLSNCVVLGSQDQQMASDAVIIPPTCSVNPSSAQVCAGATATFTATGINGSGGAPYSYSWTGPNGFTATTASITVGVAGTYSVIVRDKNGVPTVSPCTANLIVNELPNVVANDAQVCTGFTVQLSATPPGGTWSGANISPSGLFNAAGLSAGPYNVTYTYTDGNQCTNNDGAVVTVNALPTVVADNAQVCTGFTVQLSATPPGGTWSGANISASGLFNAAGLSAGPYNVTYTYTDTNQCTNNDGAVVTVNALPTVVANDAQVCTGFTVQLSATPPGGTWSGANISPSGLFDAAGLSAGPYNVTYTYTDGNQCTNNDGAVVTVNPLPIVNCPENASGPVLCGVTQAIAQAQANSDFQAWMNQFAGLNPGLNSDYEVTPSFTYSTGATPPNVGDAPLILAFSNPAIISTSVTVEWTVRNKITGCINSCNATFTLEFGCAVQCIATPTHVLCNGAATGSISVVPTGGALPYNVYLYKLPDLATPVAQVLNILTDGVPIPFNNLTAGNYVAITTDATTTIENGSACPATINQPSAVQASDSHTDVLCNGGSTGSVTINFSGGTGPYMVNFNGGGFASQVSGVVYSNLAAGDYPWIVRDANNCIFEGSETVGQPSAVQASDSHTDVLCNGGSTGSVTINFSGGTGPYMVSFNGGGFASQVSGVVYSNLAAGDYPWIVRDANNCIFEGSETVGQPSAVQASDSHTDVLCNGGSTGSVTINFSGGTGPYMVSFNGGGFASQVSGVVYSNLAAGDYPWIVRDANNCIFEGSETVGQPSAVQASDSHTDVLCNGGSTGSVTINFSGGTGPYMVSFNGGGFASQVSGVVYSNLAAGDYPWIVRDANNCIFEGSETVGQPSAVQASDSHTDVLCNGGSTGSVTINFSGGTGPYMVSFNGGGFASQVSGVVYSNLAAGDYPWIVRDANNCIFEGSETVGQPSAVQASDSHTDVLCNGGSTGSVTINFSGGTGPYMVSFNGGGFASQVSGVVYSNLAAGDYPWIVRDANNCIFEGSETVGQPSAVQASDSHTDVLCNGGSTGSVTINFSGGTGPYMVSFNGGGFASQVSGVVYSNLAAGDYPWIVRDANNCIFEGSETVGQPSAVQASDSHTDVLCNGGSTGSVTINFSGGTGPYMVNFNGGGFASQVSGVVYSNLAAGNYPWIVRDANNCIFEGSETVGQPTAVELSLTVEPENCAGTNTGSITATFSGGTDGYTISIDGGPFVPATSPHTFNNLGTGLHTVVVLDRNGCRDSAEIRVNLIVCDGPHCTYTQGYYGAYNGSACTIEGAPTTDYLIMLDAITDVGGTFDFGRLATGNYFRLFSSDITGAANIANNKIFIMLPGGGTPRALVGYDYYDNPAAVPSSWRNDGNPLTKSGPKMGAINNNLLSQTMTLFFNIHVDPTLVSFPLEVKFATQDVACGSNVPIAGTYKEFSIPASVINYLAANGGATVGNLFNLANDALGGVNVGVSHADVNKAVDAINNAFDECRVKVPLQVPFPTFVYNSVVNHEPIFTVYPVPFRDQLTIRYQFEDISKAKIDIYNSTGTLLMSQDDNNAYFNKEVTITPKFNVGEAQLYFVKVTTDRGQSVLKVISEK